MPFLTAVAMPPLSLAGLRSYRRPRTDRRGRLSHIRFHLPGHVPIAGEKRRHGHRNQKEDRFPT
jgi:hypothetical protein